MSRTVMVTGAGSGGHITPVLSVAAAIKRIDPTVRVLYVGQRGDALGDIPKRHDSIDCVYTVSAGKLRRYHGVGWRQVLDVRTMFFNVRDAFRTLFGLFQSVYLLGRTRPDVIFVKGGFVGVPLGLAAALWRVPYITHDSDVLPGLANRLIAPWATVHAVALPKEMYRYPSEKTVTVGVPVSDEYQRVDSEAQQAARRALSLPVNAPIILVSGGGLGAQRINHAVIAIAPKLFAHYPQAVIVHQAGRANEASVGAAYDATVGAHRSHVHVLGFVTNLAQYSAAADVVIARAGGTNLAELATQGKATVVIPNPFLTGGHQLHNAKVLAESNAIRIVDESKLRHNPEALYAELAALLDDPSQRSTLGRNFASMSVAGASEKLAQLLLDHAHKP